ncbi:MAG: DUF6042 family protein [Actinobacteria bacterium]|nr:DUF6042 family protein [Actinomycetota bacterium]
MPVHFPDEATTPEEGRVILFGNVAYGQGWSRYMPPASILFLGALTNEGPLSRTALEEWVTAGSRQGELGWDAPAWDPVKVWTAEEWKEFREDDWAPFRQDPEQYPGDVAEANALEVEERRRELERSDTYSRALGTEPVRTMGQVLGYMLVCGVVVERASDDEPVYELNSEVALPSEVLPLTDEDRLAEDHLRWRDVHESTAQDLIRLFDPDGEESLTTMTTTLARLARQLDMDFESVRAGIINLLDEGDFTTSIDISGVGPHERFDFVVDWDRFYVTRISLRFAGAGTEESDEADRDPTCREA